MRVSHSLRRFGVELVRLNDSEWETKTYQAVMSIGYLCKGFNDLVACIYEIEPAAMHKQKELSYMAIHDYYNNVMKRLK